MPAPFAFLNLDYQGEVVRTFSHDWEVRFVVEDIRRILGDKNPGDTPSGPEGHVRRPLVEVTSDHPPLMTSIDATGIDALLQDDRRLEAKSLRKWLKSVEIPAIREQGHHGNGSKKCDSIQAGLKALIGLRPAQLSRDRHLNALAEAVGLNENAALAISSPAGKTSMTDLIAWCQTQGVDLATRSGTTTASPSEGGMSTHIDEALKTSSSRPSMRQPDVTDGTFVEDRDEDGPPAPKARKIARRALALDHEKMIEIEEIDPRALAEERKAALRTYVDDEDDVSLRSARGLEEPIASRQPSINAEDQFKALLAITLSKD